MNRTIFAARSAVVALAMCIAYATPVLSVSAPPETVPPCSPNARRADLSFTLDDMNGKPVHLADYAGKVIVLNFWATWCGPCKPEIRALVALQEKVRDRESAGARRLRGRRTGGHEALCARIRHQLSASAGQGARRHSEGLRPHLGRADDVHHRSGRNALPDASRVGHQGDTGRGNRRIRGAASAGTVATSLRGRPSGAGPGGRRAGTGPTVLQAVASAFLI